MGGCLSTNNTQKNDSFKIEEKDSANCVNSIDRSVNDKQCNNLCGSTSNVCSQENDNPNKPVKNMKRSSDGNRQSSGMHCQERNSYKPRKSANRRQTRKKRRNLKMIDKNLNLKRDADDSVISNSSSSTRMSSVLADGKYKQVYWTNRPNYAQDFNFDRAKSQIDSLDNDSVVENHVEAKFDDLPTTSSEYIQELLNRNQSGEKAGESNPESIINGLHSEKNELSDNKITSIEVIHYLTEEDAMSQGKDLCKPLGKPLLFIGLTEEKEYHIYQPKTLSDIYKFEKLLQERCQKYKLVSLT